MRAAAAQHDVVALVRELIDSGELGNVAVAVAFNVLASLDTPDAETAVLVYALDGALEWHLRNRALMALPLFRAPSATTIERVGLLYADADADIHVRRQSVLTFGALVYQFEAAADAAVVYAEAEADSDATTLATLRQVQAAAHARSEQWRKRLHSEFMVAREAAADASELHVEQFALALHNSLKDIEPHAWMDAATILRRRGVSLVPLVPAAMESAAQRLDGAKKKNDRSCRCWRRVREPSSRERKWRWWISFIGQRAACRTGHPAMSGAVHQPGRRAQRRPHSSGVAGYDVMPAFAPQR